MKHREQTGGKAARLDAAIRRWEIEAEHHNEGAGAFVAFEPDDPVLHLDWLSGNLLLRQILECVSRLHRTHRTVPAANERQPCACVQSGEMQAAQRRFIGRKPPEVFASWIRRAG